MEQAVKKEPLNGGDFRINVSKHHTFGTDAVLLSRFAAAKEKDILCDLGTGCGIIALLMLCDKKLKRAYGVDISEEAISLCQMTKEELNLKEFTPICSDLKELKGKIPFGECTLVTCNPPYKAAGAGIVNPDSVDRVARHETACNLDDILTAAAGLLQFGGRLCMCHRPERTAELLAKMREQKIEPKKMRFVAKCKGSEPWLILVEGRRGGKTGMRVLDTLYVEENGELSPEMLKIYGKYKG